jgi:two-component system sensor histidine kinase BaeS
MRSLRARFILSHLLPILLIIPLVGIGLIYVLETQVLLTDLTESLTEEAELIAQAVEGQIEVLSDTNEAERFIASISIHLDGQVLLLGPKGELIVSGGPGQEGQTRESLDLEGLDTAIRGERSVVVTYGLFEQSASVLVPVTDIQKRLVGIVGVTERLEGLTSEFSHLRGWVLGILLIEIVLGTIIGYGLALRLERPIRKVVRAVIDIADGQPIDPLPEDGPDEIRRLSASVNILVERLRSLEALRRRSLANIVHELGRPLGALRSAIHALRGGAGDDLEIREELLEGMDDEITRMQPLLDDLAQLHGHVVGTTTLARQPLSLSDWLPSILIPWRAAAGQRELAWQAYIPPDLPTLNLDPDRMAQALGNLLSNAIKYTPAGGSVTMTAGSNQEEVWIEVHDTGPGIALEEQHQVFEPFYRSQRERRFPKGLGLGLTIARDLVEAHGGRLELSSTPGEGSRFTIHLPITT